MLNEPQLKVRVAEAAGALRGLEQDPPERAAEDHRVAMKSNFRISN